MVGKTFNQLGLPTPQRNDTRSINREMLRQTNSDIEQLESFINQQESMLTLDQHQAYDTIVEKVGNNSGGIFFLNAPAGTGKTFLINLLLAKVRSKKCIALAVASSGITATRLTDGRTAHSAFKLPLDLARSETPTCNITKNSNLAEVLKNCQLIVWDECTMSHKGAFEALDRTLKDIRGNDNLMGGVTMLLAGDFRQTLPVVPRGTRVDEMKAWLKSSSIWRKVKSFTLSTNMCVHLHCDILAGNFAERLLEFGNGTVPRSRDGIISF